MQAKHLKSSDWPGPRSSVKTAVLGAEAADPVEALHIDPRWAGYYRALLAARRRLLEARREELAEAGNPLEPHGMSPADSATDEFDHDLMLSELSASQDRLFEVDEALRRIRDGSYGICELTGQPIPAARLRAVPWARFTAEAGEKLERLKAIGKPHLGELHSVRRRRPVLRAWARPKRSEAPANEQLEIEQTMEDQTAPEETLQTEEPVEKGRAL